ncbi:hypothetical protein FB558_4220 [Pseudonocardia kunmingensis]|uniref:Uncharacterized protein n=1 Tax=Pseudonocardia kunmingensis TaxID=630975 RepID=A0A543DQP6_9PSEU|nr:hypothetical protein FB558_4220 [Pseudonocardia kunmingensis]
MPPDFVGRGIRRRSRRCGTRAPPSPFAHGFAQVTADLLEQTAADTRPVRTDRPDVGASDP